MSNFGVTHESNRESYIGNALNPVFNVSSRVVNYSVQVPEGVNAWSLGPITVMAGQAIFVPSTAVWVVTNIGDLL